MRLIKSLEEFRGCDLKVAGRRVGFNGLSVCNGDVVRKIELKTVDKSDNWFAINGIYGIESLSFDPQYYLYFVLSPEEKILIAQGVPFMQAQLPLYNVDVEEDMREWLDSTKKLSTKSGLNIIPRVNFKLKLGIRKLTALLESGQPEETWRNCVDSIWQFEASGLWRMTFPLTNQKVENES